jgi:hypothetical protein
VPSIAHIPLLRLACSPMAAIPALSRGALKRLM